MPHPVELDNMANSPCDPAYYITSVLCCSIFKRRDHSKIVAWAICAGENGPKLLNNQSWA